MTNKLKMKPGTIFCVLCQGIVSYKNGDSNRFNDHMNIEHGAYHNLRYILAGCLMNSEERNIVAEIIEERESVDVTAESELEKTKMDAEVSIFDKVFPLVKDNNDDSFTCSSVATLGPDGESLEKNVKCTLCESSFAKGAYLRKHLIRFHKLSKEERDLMNESRSNEAVGYVSPKEVNLVNGSTLDTEEEDIMVFSCHLCDYSCTKERNLKIHRTMKHIGSEKCDEKPEVKDLKAENNSVVHDILTPTELVINDVIESNQKSIKCSLCDTSFANSYNLKRHMVNQHKSDGSEDTLNKDDQLVLNCHLCDYSSVKESSLKIHKTMKHKEDEKFEEKVLTCHLCEYSCAKESSLKIHKTTKHKGNEKFEDKLLISRTLFKKKAFNNTEEVINKFKCSKCEFSGNDEKELRYHRFRTHRHAFLKRSEKLECNECDQTFYDAERLKTHKETDHRGVKLEKSQEMLLVEEPEDITEPSLEDNDSVMSFENDIAQNESMKDERNDRLKLFYDKKAEIVDKSEYFKSYAQNLLSWNGLEEDLLPGDNLPEGWGVKNSVSPAGRKYFEFVTPDRIIKLRSLISVFEYVKCCGQYDEAEIQTFELKLKAKSL